MVLPTFRIALPMLINIIKATSNRYVHRTPGVHTSSLSLSPRWLNCDKLTIKTNYHTCYSSFGHYIQCNHEDSWVSHYMIIWFLSLGKCLRVELLSNEVNTFFFMNKYTFMYPLIYTFDAHILSNKKLPRCFANDHTAINNAWGFQVPVYVQHLALPASSTISHPHE